MKKIVHLTSAHSPFDTRIFRKECATLATAGYDVTLVAPHTQDEEREGVKIAAIPKAKTRGQRFLCATWSAYARAARLGADVYHIHDPELILAGLLLRLKGACVICDLHEDVAKQVMTKAWIPAQLRKGVSMFYRKIEHALLPRFSAVVTADDKMAQRLLSMNARTISVRNFPQLNKFTPAGAERSDKSFRVANFGGVTPRRVVQQAVEGLARASEDRSFRMILGGKIYSERLFDTLRASKGWSGVQFVGMVPHHQMIWHLGTCRASIVLYSHGANHEDIRSNRLFESMGAGLPVLVPNFPNWQRFIAKYRCGLAVDPRQPAEIAEALAYLYDHPAQAEEMGRRGREAVENHFSWATEASKLLELYGDLTAEGAPTKLRST